MLVMKVMKAISELKDWGVSVLLIEQNAPAAPSITDRVYVMQEGRIVSQGYPEELLSMYGSGASICDKKEWFQK
jgi:branched-chain amino acid transport system ATP-binding protein